MTEDDLKLAANKLRLHIKANPKVAAKVAEAIDEASQSIGMKLPKDFFSRLLIVHEVEMDTAFSVTILPVGSQCGV